jgi:AraC family transcriptional regulator of adaptative response / DNA-3-methyladenine glycosylase II
MAKGKIQEDPERDRLEAAVAALRRAPGDFAHAAQFATASGFAPARLRALVRRHYHTTLARLVLRARLEAAAQHLVTRQETLEQIADEVGLDGLGDLSKGFFRRQRICPKAYSGLLGKKAVEIHLPEGYPRRRLLAHLGRDPESLTQRVEGAEAVLGVRLDTTDRPAGQAARRVPATLRISLSEGRARAEVTASTGSGRLPEDAAVQAHALLLRLLGLHADPAPFERRAAADPATAPLVARRRGLRIPQLPSPFDALTWTVIGQQINLAFAFTLHRRMIERAGIPVGGGLFAPPAPEAVADLTVEELHRVQYSRRKAEYLITLSQRVAAGALPLDALGDAPATRVEETLLAERGIGPWSAHYLLMRGYGFEDCVPLGDTGLRSGLERLFHLEKRPTRDEIEALMERFAPYRSHATFALWQSLEDEP